MEKCAPLTINNALQNFFDLASTETKLCSRIFTLKFFRARTLIFTNKVKSSVCSLCAKYPFIASQLHDFVSCINYIIISIHCKLLILFLTILCALFMLILQSFIIVIMEFVFFFSFSFYSFALFLSHFISFGRFKFNNGNLCKLAWSFIKSEHIQIHSLNVHSVQCNKRKIMENIEHFITQCVWMATGALFRYLFNNNK